VAGFDGDGGGGFAAKVGFGELRPKVFEGLRVAGELGFGLFARAVFAGVQAVLVVFELVPGLLVEVVEEAGAPGVPEAGVGGADVGEGQQVEVVEVFGAGDGRGVGGDGVGVGEVFFLRGEAVVEVVGDEPGEQGAVFGRDGVVFARVEVGDLRAGLAVVAVVAFADVVKFCGDFSKIWLNSCNFAFIWRFICSDCLYFASVQAARNLRCARDKFIAKFEKI